MFEKMHYVCFHYEFEHELHGADVDADCGSVGCPSAVLPVSPCVVGEGLLREVAEAMREPYDAGGWAFEAERQGVVRATRAGSTVRLIAVDVTAPELG